MKGECPIVGANSGFFKIENVVNMAIDCSSSGLSRP